jgi:exonuclease III
MYSTPPSTVAAPGGGPNPTPHPPSNNINIATVNVDGIKTKLNALKAFIASDQIKILSITETHTQNTIHVPNFSSYSRPSRFNNFYRGVALLIDSNINSIKHDLPPHLSDLEAVAADAQLNNKTITIISYYNPPSESISPELFQYVSSLRYCIILGDFNARHTDFGDRSTNANGRKFSEFISDLSIYRLENRSATFISHKNVDAQSIVDHIVITESLTAHVDSESFIGTTVTSDHEPLVAKLFFEGPPPPPEFIQIFKYKNADWDKYRREITRTLTRTTPANTPDEIDEQINTFTNTIHSARDTVFKPTTIPKNRTPLPARIVKLIKEKRKVYREFIQSRDPLLKTLFNKLNAQIRRDINIYREETWIKTCESLDYRDGKKFWNKFKGITGQKRKTNHFLATDAHIYYTPQERANCFAELLDGIHQVPNDPNFNATFFDQIANNVHAFKNIPLIDPLPHPLHDEHLTDNITTDEVKIIISHLKNTKAPGPDQIRPILLKNLPDSAFQALTDIFNNCMNNLYFPTAWKTAHTVMIPKPGKCPNDPKSYRPISLLSITGKIFERILTNRLQLTLESNNLLPPEQFGFRAQRSTHNPLAELQTDITRHANLGECTVGVFLDIERAFDKVWHDGLVQKLLNLRLNLKFTKLISSFLTNRSCRIKVNKILSNTVHLKAGVPQGSVLSPLLYIVYCRDFPFSDIQRTKTRMFADDTAIWCSQRSCEKATSIVQKELHCIEKWTNHWRVKINPTKSQSILFTFPKAQKQRTLFTQSRLVINRDVIPKNNTVQYLGITVSSTCTLHADLKATLKKARNRANLLYKIRGRLRGCAPETLLYTYNSFIRPVIEYRALLYSTLPKRAAFKIYSFERHTLRDMFRLHRQHPSNTLYDATKTTPISERLTLLQARYIERTLNGNNTIAKQTLHTSHKLPTKNGLLNRVPKKPKVKTKHLPTAILSSKYPDLPPELQLLVDETPLSMR